MSTRTLRFRATSTTSHPPDRERQEELERQVQETARRQDNYKRREPEDDARTGIRDRQDH
jgi:hypothetical protein